MKYSFRGLQGVRIVAAAAALALAAGAAAAQEGTTPQEEPTAQQETAAPADPNAVVATINGEPVTEGDLTLAMSDLGEQFAQLPADQRRAAALSAIIEIRLLSEKAEAAGLADSDEFKRRMELLRQRALHTAYIENEIASAVTDEAVKARYDEEVAKVPPSEEVHARHILVKTKEEADAIIKQLDEGGDFEALANEHTTDPSGKASGGDLGYFGPGQMVPAFEQAAFALEPGNYTKEPVESQFGWHIIKVEDKRAKAPPALEQVESQIRSLMLREAYFEAVAELRGEAGIEITDPALKQAIEPEAAPEAAEQPAEGAEQPAATEEPAEETETE